MYCSGNYIPSLGASNAWLCKAHIAIFKGHITKKCYSTYNLRPSKVIEHQICHISDINRLQCSVITKPTEQPECQISCKVTCPLFRTCALMAVILDSFVKLIFVTHFPYFEGVATVWNRRYLRLSWLAWYRVNMSHPDACLLSYFFDASCSAPCASLLAHILLLARRWLLFRIPCFFRRDSIPSLRVPQLFASVTTGHGCCDVDMSLKI